MPLNPESDETVALGAKPPTPPPTPRTNQHRFDPGTLLASRYRIVSRLGQGGMGEVFRADDIVLGQSVALKFLPESAKNNINFLTRFYDEVRIARQVSHPNVCRVYDIGEIDGHLYLSMEYIDGEDLASLLRRIGRLPGDKATEFARKICAGLSAAHAQGVLHRDIKPGNIMIDGRGEPRITDFGLAAVASAIEGNEIRNGTPAYMAPEQLEGREVSTQSDVYALGLVFYEMFSGKAPHAVETVAQLTRARRDSKLTSISTLVPDIDPAVDRAITASLQPDARLRPKSALELARMLPGGDPMEMALAAGQTPSPEMVAAAGSCDALPTRMAIGAVAIAFVALALLIWLGSGFQVANHAPIERPEVLESKAHEIVRGLGYTDAPADSVTGFQYDNLYAAYQRSLKLDRPAWIKALEVFPSPVTFWYRQSPASLVAQNVRASGSVAENDPPPTLAGMVSARVAMDGRLLAFTAVPPEKQATTFEGRYDWSPLFAAAKLDPSTFTPAVPEWTPVVAADQRAAWTGAYPGKDNLEVRVEAGAFQGKPVYFSIVWPWTPLQRTVADAGSIAARRSRAQAVFGIVSILTFLVTAILAHINLEAGRVDFQGAHRLAMFLVGGNMLVWLLNTHLVSSVEEPTLWLAALANSIGAGMLAWGLYLALEPLVRRYWPQALMTWSRVIAGRWRDPMVGRDILIALAIGTLSTLYFCVLHDGDIITIGNFQIRQLLGTREVLQVIASDTMGGISAILLYFMVMFLLRALLRKTWLASVVFVALWCTYRGFGDGAEKWWNTALLLVPVTVLFVLLLNRFGFLATVLGAVISDVSIHLVMTPDLTAWYGQSTLILVLLWIAIGAYGYMRAVGDRSPWTGAFAPRGYNR